MSRLTGNEVQDLMEAYSAVYSPQISLTEEQFYDEIHYWVNTVLDEGYDLSAYTWDDIYNFAEEYYLWEDEYGRGARSFGQGFGQGLRNVGTNVLRGVGDAARGASDVAGAYLQGIGGQETTSKNPLAQASNAYSRTITSGPRAGIRFIQGAGEGLAGTRPGSPTAKPAPPRAGEALVGSATRPGGLKVTDRTLAQAQRINRKGGIQMSTGEAGFLAKKGDQFVIKPRKPVGADDSLIGKAARALGLTKQQDLAKQKAQQDAARRNRTNYLGPKNPATVRPAGGIKQDLTPANKAAYSAPGGKLGGVPTGSAVGKPPKK